MWRAVDCLRGTGRQGQDSLIRAKRMTVAASAMAEKTRWGIDRSA